MVDLSGNSSTPELRLNIPSALTSFVALGVSPGKTAGSGAPFNFMTGPPHAEAVVGLGSEIGVIVLDDMPSRVDFQSSGSLTPRWVPWTHCLAHPDQRQWHHFQFRASRVGTRHTINSPVNIIYAYGDDDDASGTGKSVTTGHGGVLKDLNLFHPRRHELQTRIDPIL